MSAENPIIICTYENLNNMRNDLTGGKIVKHYALGGDIDARSSWDDHRSQANCTPYNGMTIASSGTPCSGFVALPALAASFDGKGYSISNLYIYMGGDEIGLFYRGRAGGIIKNLHLKSIRVHNTKTSGTPSTGGIIGGVYGFIRINESSVTGKISGSSTVGGMIGGIVGSGSIVVKNSYTDVTVTGTQWVGGIIGNAGAGSEIANSHSRGTVTRTGNGYGGAGGIVGVFPGSGDIENSYSHASVSGVYGVGSLVGRVGAESSVVNSYGTGLVAGSGASKGGIGGSINTTQGEAAILTNNFWDTDTTGQAADTDQGTGLSTSGMKVSCAGISTGICALGSAFVFTQGSYPKIKKCATNCGTNSATYSDDLVIGQD